MSYWEVKKTQGNTEYNCCRSRGVKSKPGNLQFLFDTHDTSDLSEVVLFCFLFNRGGIKGHKQTLDYQISLLMLECFETAWHIQVIPQQTQKEKITHICHWSDSNIGLLPRHSLSYLPSGTLDLSVMQVCHFQRSAKPITRIHHTAPLLKFNSKKSLTPLCNADNAQPAFGLLRLLL